MPVSCSSSLLPATPALSSMKYFLCICYFYLFKNTSNVIFVGFQEGREKKLVHAVSILSWEALALYKIPVYKNTRPVSLLLHSKD